jgi:hypothetical protein
LNGGFSQGQQVGEFFIAESGGCQVAAFAGQFLEQFGHQGQIEVAAVLVRGEVSGLRFGRRPINFAVGVARSIGEDVAKGDRSAAVGFLQPLDDDHSRVGIGLEFVDALISTDQLVGADVVNDSAEVAEFGQGFFKSLPLLGCDGSWVSRR